MDGPSSRCALHLARRVAATLLAVALVLRRARDRLFARRDRRGCGRCAGGRSRRSLAGGRRARRTTRRHGVRRAGGGAADRRARGDRARRRTRSGTRGVSPTLRRIAGEPARGDPGRHARRGVRPRRRTLRPSRLRLRQRRRHALQRRHRQRGRRCDRARDRPRAPGAAGSAGSLGVARAVGRRRDGDCSVRVTTPSIRWCRSPISRPT